MNIRFFGVMAVIGGATWIAGCGDSTVSTGGAGGLGVGGQGIGGQGIGGQGIGGEIGIGGVGGQIGLGGAGGATGGDCTCACDTLISANGCADLCDSAQNGNPNTPNFCNGVAALPQCAACLQDSCGFDSTQVTDGTQCSQ